MATFYIQAVGNATITLSKVGTPIVGDCMYGINNTTVPNSYTYGDSISLTSGQKCYFTITATSDDFDTTNYLNFTSTGNIKVGGNLSDLIGGTDSIPRNYCFSYLFYNCTRLWDASNLVLCTNFNSKTRCYSHMFEGCTELTSTPALLATNLTLECYCWMFGGCSSLITASDLHATTLANSCCSSMFRNCISLKKIPKLPATTLAENCYQFMFWGCKSLKSIPELPATTLAESCYNRMFQGCKSLMRIPNLPATTLVQWCYCSMFASCTSLKLSTTQSGNYKIPYRIPTTGTGTTTGFYSLQDMFYGTGGTFTGTPTINTTYYLYSMDKDVILNDGNYQLYPQTKVSNIIDAATNIKTIENNTILGSGNIDLGIHQLELDISSLTANKEPTLTNAKLEAVVSGITSGKVTIYDGYAASIQQNADDIDALEISVAAIPDAIDTKINAIGSSSKSAASGKALSGVTVGISNGTVTVTGSEINVPTNNNQLTNGAGYQTSSQVTTAISNALTEKINENVLVKSNNNILSYSGDTVTISAPYKNLNTGDTGTKTETVALANSTTAGLMSPSDVNTLSDHGTRISALEGTTNRVLYVINSDLGPIGSYPIAFTIKGVVYSIEGSTITEHNGASPEPTYTMDAQGNVTIHGIAYTFDVANMHGQRAATKSNIGQFAINEGFVAPFRGVAIVVEETFHIWRYYTNTEQGEVIGWKDDGQDTVSAFTNSVPGIIQGSATDGKIYAENDGTGSVYGWSALTGRVTTLESRPTNVMTFTSGTSLPATGSIGQIFFNTSNNLVYIYNGTTFMAINTYQ